MKTRAENCPPYSLNFLFDKVMVFLITLTSKPQVGSTFTIIKKVAKEDKIKIHLLNDSIKKKLFFL